MAPAAFGRLCVETALWAKLEALDGFPAAFGRLCVETTSSNTDTNQPDSSRLRAAVC